MADMTWIVGLAAVGAGLVAVYYFRNQIGQALNIPQISNDPAILQSIRKSISASDIIPGNVGFGNPQPKVSVPAKAPSSGSSGNCSWDAKGGTCWSSKACGAPFKVCGTYPTTAPVANRCSAIRDRFLTLAPTSGPCKSVGAAQQTAQTKCPAGPCAGLLGATCQSCLAAHKTVASPAKPAAKAPSAAKIAQCAGFSGATKTACLNSAFARTRAWTAVVR